MRRALFVLLAMVSLGCSQARIPPPYTQRELELQCQRHGGRWHDDELLFPTFCEYDSRT